MTVVIVASAGIAGVSLVAGTASAAPTGVADCTVIDQPGAYELTSNVSPDDPTDGGPCIAVRTDDVSIDGDGHAVALGNASNGSGIVAGASGATALANVTVRDVTVRAGDGATGVAYRNVIGGVVANVTAEAGRPLRVDGGEGVAVCDSAFTSVDAAAVRVTADDATVVDNGLRVTSTTNVEGSDSLGGLYVGGSNGTLHGNTVNMTALETAYDDYGVRVGGSNYTVVDNEVTGEAAVGMVIVGSDNVVASNDVSETIVTGVAVGGSNNTLSDTYTTNTLLVNGTDALVEDVAIVHASNGVQVEGSDNAFVNVTLVDIGTDAMDMTGANNTVTDLTVSNSWGGVYVRGSNNTLSDSTVERVNTRGIGVTGSNNTLSDVTASNNGDGVTVSGSNNTLSDNAASENRIYGFSIDGANNTLSDNAASENRGSGFSINGSDNTVVGNDAASNGVGFSVEGSNTTVVGNDANDSRRGVVVYGNGNTVRSNRIHNATEVGVSVRANRTLVYDNLIETAAGGERVVAADRSAIVRGRGPGQSHAAGIRVHHSNAWNVTARSGENVVGGSTTGGNYYAVVDGTGFSEACRDADRDGICDDPNALSPNDTDYLPLADDTNASVGYLEVTDVDAPATFEWGEAGPVTATVKNVGTETVTQSVTVASVESSPASRTVTLAPGETATVTFDVVVGEEPERRLSLVPVTVSSANASLTARVLPVRSKPSFYQVDFVAGEPIENLSVVNLYAQDDRLFQYAFGEADEGITSLGSAWENETLRECVDHGAITDEGNGTASVTFTVAENCSSRAFSLAVYSMPDDEFSLSTVDQQELLNATTGTYGPGEHTITVDLPDGDASDD
ncbi:right-handed parallel beta-helix repeat-containing protein [Candidatus Halobonum tyrrellensis]|uniref:Periplasmic copper-binding protein n=1 Tax=Candidatus Halobonum tyrrellensis G22 TaxID=1324957 RepID=V4HLQ8_9EURY|nr:right-handed parallel beta-helix repeat-containing protein [Candidatus Halobonum tyrrellensis]ESP88834.1 periplasmic copper-binding protein [Candidatus Halobonum tyrrellensis G22]